MSALTRPVRTLLGALREALSNEGIRRLEAAWALGIAGDTGLLVVLLVVVYLRDGAVGVGILGASRMIPAIVTGMLSGATLERFRGERVLLVVALARAAAAALCAVVIATHAPGWLLYVILAGSLEPLSFAPGEKIMREGEPGDRFVVVASGEVEVSVDGRPMQRLGRGAGLGEIALLRRSPRTATVMALTPVQGFAISCGSFVAAVSGPAAAIATERIAEANVRRGVAGGAAAPGA